MILGDARYALRWGFATGSREWTFVYLPLGELGNMVQVGNVECGCRSFSSSSRSQKGVKTILTAADGDDMNALLDERVGEL
jgi:hypothetical protein